MNNPVLQLHVFKASTVTMSLYVTTLNSRRGPGERSRATSYGLGSLWIESPWQQYFRHSFRPVLGSIQPPPQFVPGIFPGNKAAGA